MKLVLTAFRKASHEKANGDKAFDLELTPEQVKAIEDFMGPQAYWALIKLNLDFVLEWKGL